MGKKVFFSSISKGFAVLMILILFLGLVPYGAVSEPILEWHNIIIVQGDDPSTPEIESEDNLIATEFVYFLVPWNESIVRTFIPKSVTPSTIVVDQVVEVTYPDQSTAFVYGEYSALMNPQNPPYKEFIDKTGADCCIAHWYLWGYPNGSSRDMEGYAHGSSGDHFNQSYDSIISDDVWNFTGPGLELKEGESAGEYISIPMEIFSTYEVINITSIEMDWNVTEFSENVSFSVSINNGTHWLDMNPNKGQLINFTTPGNELLWKMNMTQNVSLNNTPLLSDLWINITYTPAFSELVLQMNYVMPKDPVTDQFQFIMDLYEDMKYQRDPHVLVYVNPDHSLSANGMPFTFYDTQSQVSGKELYFFMPGTGEFSPEVTITIPYVGSETSPNEEGDFPWLYIILLIIILAMIAVLLIVPEKKKEDEEGDIEADTEELEQLEQKKEKLQMAISKLDSDFEEDLIDEETYDELKAGYEEKEAGVSKEIGILAASIASAKARRTEDSEEEISEEKEALLEKKKKLLLAIKKLDSDFEDDVIDEDTYKDLKADYKKKAAGVLKEIDALGAGVVSAGTGEDSEDHEEVISEERKALMDKKEKILKSIKKLDSDYEEGLIDEDVYEDLRKSYKKKAVEILKELEE
jgi:hypothetical protein